MPAKKTAKRKTRVPLDHERICGAALRLADDEGVAGLTMRGVAAALGVEAMSLYHHVENKEAILDGIVDLVFSEITLPTGADWQGAVRTRMTSARQVLLRHPWAVGLMDSRRNPGRATLMHHDAMIGCLRGAGFSIVMTAHAISLIDAYLYGFAIQELSLPITKGPAETQEVVETIFDVEAAKAFPHITELAMEHVMKPGYDYADEFTFGLDLILAGLEARRASSPMSPSSAH